jgi:hypothetical protein
MPCLIGLKPGLTLMVCSGDFPGDACHFYLAPRKYVLVASEEVDELTFLFGVQTCPNLHGFVRVYGINLHDLGMLGRFESVRR